MEAKTKMEAAIYYKVNGFPKNYGFINIPMSVNSAPILVAEKRYKHFGNPGPCCKVPGIEFWASCPECRKTEKLYQKVLLLDAEQNMILQDYKQLKNKP